MVTIVRPFIEAIGEETVVFRPRQKTDPWGDPVDGPAAESVEVPRSAVYPRGADEAAFRASTTTDDLVALLPIYETDLDVEGGPTASEGTIEWRGRQYAIEGNPMPWVHGDGKFAGVQVNLTRGGG